MRAERLIAILMALHRGRTMTAGELANRLHVSVRTIFRELGITAMAVARPNPGFQYPEKRVEAFEPSFAAGALATAPGPR